MEHLDSETARNFLHQTLPVDALTDWKTHISGCALCQRTIETERALAGLLRLGDDVPVDEDSTTRMVERLEAYVPGSQAQHRQSARLVVLSMCFGMLLGIAYHVALAPLWAKKPDAPRELTTLERAAAARLDTLQTLQQDLWIVSDLETARWLERLVLSKEEPTP